MSFAPFTFADACEIVGGGRPVSLADPAWFSCGPKTSPDYGCVFWASSANPALTIYSFDREGLNFARLCPAPDGDWLEVQGRLFRIAGPVAGKAVAA